MKIAVLKETRAGEKRVALAPAVTGKLIKLGADLHMQAGAGDAAKLPDTSFQQVAFEPDVQSLLHEADIVLSVQAPAIDAVRLMKPGAILICLVYANREPELVKALRGGEITTFAMETVPRISRAQAIDVLSTQSALSGYYAPLRGAANMPRILPMMTTAVGSLRAAKVLVMGLGVANILANLLFTHPDLFDRTVLMHPLIPFTPAPQPGLKGRKVLITAGQRDPICPPPLTIALSDYLSLQGAEVKTEWHPGGHDIRPNEIEAVQGFLGG